jgi:hypothetical protein
VWKVLIDLHFYDFTFQREVLVEGNSNLAWNTWTRNVDRLNEDKPSQKRLKREIQAHSKTGALATVRAMETLLLGNMGGGMGSRWLVNHLTRSWRMLVKNKSRGRQKM